MSDSQSYQDQIKPYLDLLNQQIRQPAAMPTGTPDDGTSPSWTGLLGSVLSGGQTPGYKLRGSEADTSGNRALLNFGIQTLLASGPAPVRPSALSAVATGLQGAEQSMGQDQQRAGALATAQYGATRQQQQDRLAALKEALPLLQLQQKASAIAGAKPPWEGDGTGTAGAPGAGDGFTGDKEKDRAIIAKRESGGDPTALNYVAQQDPTAYDRGATASGKYQFVNSTWAEGLKLAGLDPSKYARAMDAPEAVQDKVFDAVYAKYGTKPWQKGAKDWVKDENGKYQLATVRPAAPPAAPGGGVAARTGGTNVAGPGAGATAPAPAPGPSTVDLDGPRPLPPAGPGSPVVTPASLANTPMMVPGKAPAPPGAPTTTPPGAPVPQQTSQTQPLPVAGTTPPAPAITPSTPEGVPDTFEEYQKQYPIVVPPEMQELFKKTPAGSALAILQQQEANFRSEWTQAHDALDPAGMAKATEAINTVRAKQAELIQGADKQGGDAQASWLKDQRSQLFEAWKEAQKIKQDRITENNKINAQGEQTRLTNREAVVNSVNQKGLETANKEQSDAIGAVRQLEGFRSISEMVGQPGWMQTTKFPGSEQSIAERLQQLGLKQDDTAGVQLMRGAMTNLTRTLREGMAMGALSDRDLNFIERMGPTEWMDPDTRTAAVDYLQKAYRAKQRFAFEVQSEMGKGKNHGDALDAANAKVKDFVPRVSPELSAHWNDNSKEWSDARLQWAIDNDVRPGTLFHFPNGAAAIMKRPKPAGAP